jgi:hypothetical protein
MDILNFISWIKGGRRFTSVDPNETLLPVGVRDLRRDDKYLTGAISIQDLINEIVPLIPPSGNYGLYTQTNSSTPVTNTTAEVSLLDGGLGTLTVPANGFQVGDSFHAVATGHISSVNNHTLRIRIKTGSVVLADTGTLTMAGSTDKHWKLDVNFTVRALGPSGTAEIVTGGIFFYTKDASNSFEGTNFSTEVSTGFDTTISNTLSVTAQWGTASTGDSIYSELFTLNKTY